MLATAIQTYQQRVDHQLTERFSALAETAPQLKAAMTHGALLGGKRIRPFLVYSVGQMLGVALEKLDACAAAIECIHAYSLIHDDLPAMDNDDLRRGQPTVHIAFD
ncbi:MAG: polyprenyl synthetase family protein, partial [Shewanella sp.]